MRILVTAATKHDSTRKIADEIGRILSDAGLDVEVRKPDMVENVERYDAVVLGSAVYYGRWMAEATAFADRHRSALLQRPVWLFSSGPLGTDPKPEGDPENIAELSAAVGARSHRVFAGELDRSRLGVAEKLVVRAVKAPDGDFRDWGTIDTWAREIARQLKEAPAPAAIA
jgi:menaquinone-dependent protoporphyrinogen oxidase